MDDEVQQIQNQIAQAKTGEVGLDQALRVFGERRHAEDRSFIVKWVVGLYVGSVAVAILYLLVRGACFGEDHFQDISELIKIAVIPVLTLVIGYYFGTARS